jgi:hypothetical protein
MGNRRQSLITADHFWGRALRNPAARIIHGNLQRYAPPSSQLTVHAEGHRNDRNTQAPTGEPESSSARSARIRAFFESLGSVL